MLLGLAAPLVVEYLTNDVQLSVEKSPSSQLGISSLLFVILGVHLFVFTLHVNAAAVASRFSPEGNHEQA